MKIEPADVAEPWTDQDVGRIAREPRSGDAILHDIVGFDHHRGQAGTSRSPKNLPFHETLYADALAPVEFDCRFVGLVLVEAVARNCAAAAEKIRIEVDRNDHAGIESACGRDRHRIDERAVDQPALSDAHRCKYAGQGIRGTQGFNQPAAGEPYFVTRVDLGGYGGKARGERFDFGAPERLFEMTREAHASDQSRS